jgi:uncharacterized damage-inducible protein DinB
MPTFFEDYMHNLQELHNDILAALRDLSSAALDWRPDTDMNSISALVVHTVGAQRYLIGEVIGGDPANRDREAEFKAYGLNADNLMDRLNESFEYIHSVLGELTEDVLSSRRDHRGRERTVAWVLDHALKHTATHLGHIQVTRQFWEIYGRTTT